MVRRKKYIPPASLSLREMIRNMIKTSCHTYNGKDFTTTLGTLFFLMHGTKKEEVFIEIAKWVDLDGTTEETPIVLPSKFFD